jgi:hypothetical protein
VKAVLRRKLPAREKAVLNVYAIHADRDGCAYPGIKTVAEETGLGRSTVCRAITALIACGELIEIAKGGGRRSTTYQLGCMAKTLPLFAKQITEIEKSEPQNGTAAVPKLDTAAVPERDGSCPKSAPAIRKELTYNNHVTDIEGERPAAFEISDFDCELDFAVAKLMDRLTIFGSKNRAELRGVMATTAQRLKLPPIRAGDQMAEQFERYRSLGGRKEPYWFMADGFHLKTEPEWNLNGANQGSGNQPRSAYGRKLAALDALFADAEEVPQGTNGDPGEPARRPG